MYEIVQQQPREKPYFLTAMYQLLVRFLCVYVHSLYLCPMIRLKIKEICARVGITQGELAARLGISPESLSRTLNRDARISSLEKVADALGVHISDLFEQDERPPVAKCPHCGKAFQIDLRALFEE